MFKPVVSSFIGVDKRGCHKIIGGGGGPKKGKLGVNA